MERLTPAWAHFSRWHWLARRAAFALAFYGLALLGVLAYAGQLQQAGKMLFTAGSIGFCWAIGGWYVLRGGLWVAAWWLRLFR
ncbi:Tetrathionate reductase subunit C [Paraburkholderia unamae]|uniref:hypothetical protein n=1 Tax=Paraburkholderia unamae TaxID=219649 RepID=UPI001CB06BD7|nr:hypothetical protein [Paraburkholderia unamae]CAG9255168.1 Tetrathionate reductase subunit C [Paraburkholderia unamae]